MTEYTLDVNGRRYKLNDEFKESIQQRAKSVYSDNKQFSCWWNIAKRDNYTDEAWENNIHEEGDPILTIETEGTFVPWDDLDQLEAMMPKEMDREGLMSGDDDDVEEIDAGNGMKTLPPNDGVDKSNKEIFGRTHFPLTPRDFEELPEPASDDPDKIPPKPVEVGDKPELIVRVPRHPELEHTWEAGEAVTSMKSWIEWNVQQRANQPNLIKDKSNCHDSFESLCKIHDCEKIGEYTPSNDIPEGRSGSVKRKGERAFEDGRYGGDNWSI